ncbi:MAG: tRNA uracil 4-sulfurtransferase ThiI [Gemmatimonadota bacterium]
MDLDDKETLILVRISGELATKARGTRNRFQRQLISNLREALAVSEIPFELRHEWGRVYIEAGSRRALEVVPRVFGIKSISEVEATVAPDLKEIVSEGERIFADRVRGRSFAVRARRAGRHSFSSGDIHNELGAALNAYGRVDLGAPDVTVRVEVRSDAAYMFSRIIPGGAGVPVGVGGRAIALISGGFDSAVAAWMMLKRGVVLDYVFCNLAGAAYERAALAVTKRVADDWSYGTRPLIHVLDFEQPIAELKRTVRESYWQVVLKRMMYRAAEMVARQTGAGAIVTGEAIGQVSSQTLDNLGAIGSCLTLPVIRPVVGFDKEEIIARSREIGTYALSEKVQEHCALSLARPVTAARTFEVDREETRMDLAALEAAVAERRTLDLRGLGALDATLPYLYTTEVPEGAVVIDTRSAREYEVWHYPGAIRREYWDLLRDFTGLDLKPTYALYCDVGLKTAQLVEKMQRAGYEAYSFKGGAAALRSSVEGVERLTQP